MTLSDYLRKNQLSFTDFGKSIGITSQAVARHSRGERWPRPEIMRRIVNATDGSVMPNDFLDDDLPEPFPMI